MKKPRLAIALLDRAYGKPAQFNTGDETRATETGLRFGMRHLGRRLAHSLARRTQSGDTD